MKIANYKGLELGRAEATPVTKEEVNAEIETLLASKLSTKEKEGKSSLGDIVNIDYEGFLDGVPFDGGKDTGYDLELGSGSFIPGFEEALVGYEKGADVDVNVTFPTEYHAENLAGKAVVFKCHIHAVKERVEPVLNDELAQEFGIPTADQLVTVLEGQLNAKKAHEAENEYLDKLIKKLAEESEVEVTEELVNNKLDELIGYYEQNMAQFGMSLESYLNMSGKTMDEFRESIKEEAATAAKEDQILVEIANLEGLTATDEEVDADMQMYKQYYNLDDETFKRFVSEEKDNVKSGMLKRKAVKFLLENNK